MQRRSQKEKKKKSNGHQIVNGRPHTKIPTSVRRTLVNLLKNFVHETAIRKHSKKRHLQEREGEIGQIRKVNGGQRSN